MPGLCWLFCHHEMALAADPNGGGGQCDAGDRVGAGKGGWPGTPCLLLTDLSVEKATGHFTMMSGSAHILALWKPMGRPEFDAGELYHIAILEAHVMQDEKTE